MRARMRPSMCSCPPGSLASLASRSRVGAGVLARSLSQLSLASLASFALAGLAGCDRPASDAAPEPTAASTAPAAPAPPPAPEPVRAPEIIVDRATVAIGADRVATGETALADKLAAMTTGKPGIEGRGIDVVAMRNAKPSQVADVVAALRGAKASAVTIKTSARDDTTQKMPLAFGSTLQDCAVVAWIAKDGVIDVWPAGGGAAHRVARGLAGPDMTLGMDAVRTQWAGCNAPTIAVGGDDAMSWGLVFDLATSALQAPGSRASTVALVTAAVPGKKLVLP
jgi:hypothetical protein